MLRSRSIASRIAVLLLAAYCAVARADVDAGIAAYQRGDYAAAFSAFAEAARKNDPLALNVLGIMYAEGRSVERNEKLAVDLFFKAQALGSLEASANLGRMYADGRGVRKDDGEALRHFRDAAIGGYLPAMKRLAEIYQDGELGVAPDPVQASEWRARLGGTPTALMHRAPPSNAAIPPHLVKPSERPKTSTPPVAKPQMPIARRPTVVDVDFESRVLAQLEKYHQRTRRLQVASTDSMPALAAYLKGLRARLADGTRTFSSKLNASSAVTMTLSILGDGTLKRVELDRSSGNALLDRKLLAAVNQLGHLESLPPTVRAGFDVVEVTVRLPIE